MCEVSRKVVIIITGFSSLCLPLLNYNPFNDFHANIRLEGFISFENDFKILTGNTACLRKVHDYHLTTVYLLKPK